MPTIRPYAADDWPAVWRVLEPILRRGDTYVLAPDITQQDAQRFWIGQPLRTYVACDDGGAVVASYFIRPNQPGLGSHVCNCAYVVDAAASGRGIASAMCAHSQQEASRLGFTAMQFNFVVSTNEAAVRLWKKHGFEVVGVLPKAFRHPSRGLVDALVMHKFLA
jgi:ribosomal protein S18 acetylase RimI-like enzyme